jgi:hypothetical protein
VLHVNHTGAHLASVLRAAPVVTESGSGADAVVGGSTD